MSYEILWEEEGVKLISTGVFDNDYLSANIEVTTDPRFIDARYGIVDFLNVDSFPVDSNTIKQIALVSADAYKLNPELKLTILASELVMAGLVNMFEQYFELYNDDNAWEMKIFNTEDQAREWINAQL